MISFIDILIEYLSPYSPFLNPIENCFLKWKNYVIRKEAKNKIELQQFIHNGFRSITEADCDGFFRKMLRYVIRAERGNEILE